MKKTILITTALLCTHINANSINSDWMATLPPQAILNQLVIPGTHDSGSYSISAKSKFSMESDSPVPEWLEKISNWFPVSIVRAITANWSKTQPLSIGEQLNNGSRYIDMRVCYSKNNETDKHFYTCHGLLGTELKVILNDVHQFASQHRHEVIILDLNHIYGVKNANDQQALIDMVQSYLKDDTVPNTLHPNNTLADIYQTQRNVIVMYQSAFAIAHPDFMNQYIWQENEITSKWFNTTDVNQLHNGLDDEAKTRAAHTSNTFDVAQFVLTPNDKTITNNLFSTIQYFTQTVDSDLPSWLNQFESSYGQQSINIVEQDWFTANNPVVPLAQAIDQHG